MAFTFWSSCKIEFHVDKFRQANTEERLDQHLMALGLERRGDCKNWDSQKLFCAYDGIVENHRSLVSIQRDNLGSYVLFYNYVYKKILPEAQQQISSLIKMLEESPSTKIEGVKGICGEGEMELGITPQ